MKLSSHNLFKWTLCWTISTFVGSWGIHQPSISSHSPTVTPVYRSTCCHIEPTNHILIWIYHHGFLISRRCPIFLVSKNISITNSYAFQKLSNLINFELLFVNYLILTFEDINFRWDLIHRIYIIWCHISRNMGNQTFQRFLWW